MCLGWLGKVGDRASEQQAAGVYGADFEIRPLAGIEEGGGQQNVIVGGWGSRLWIENVMTFS